MLHLSFSKRSQWITISSKLLNSWPFWIFSKTCFCQFLYTLGKSGQFGDVNHFESGWHQKPKPVFAVWLDGKDFFCAKANHKKNWCSFLNCLGANSFRMSYHDFFDVKSLGAWLAETPDLMPNPKTERETVTFVAPTGLRPVSRRIWWENPDRSFVYYVIVKST